MNAEEAEAAGYIVDQHCYPWIAYKGPRFAPARIFTIETPAHPTAEPHRAPTIERRALDRLLAIFADFDVLHIDWQLGQAERVWGPWVMVRVGQRSSDFAESWAQHTYAIWKETGDIYGVGFDGAVHDAPFLLAEVPG